MLWMSVVITTMLLGGIGQFLVKNAYTKWGSVVSEINATGAEMATRMLTEQEINDVVINVVSGTLTDYFDPTNKTLNLSQEVAYGNSVASHAIACHEAGHYIQFEQGYFPLRMRRTLVPITNFSSQLTWIILIIGITLQAVGLIYLAAACYGVSLLFALVTLPVELNASKRAIQYLDNAGVLAAPESKNEYNGTRSMLRAAASTYLFAVIASAINLLYILALARR